MFRVLGVQGLGFRVLGFRISGFRVWGFRAERVLDLDLGLGVFQAGGLSAFAMGRKAVGLFSACTFL